MSTILCVDGDVHLTDLLTYMLTREGYQVLIANSGAIAVRLAYVEIPDLVLLQSDLPDMDGLNLCARFHSTLHIPVIVLADHNSDEEIIKSFERGADDCIAKPFNMRILYSRLQAILRRTCPTSFPATNYAHRLTYRSGDASFSIEHNQLIGPLGCVQLTRTEMKIVQLLLAHQNQLLSAERIMERVWGYDSESEVGAVKTHIRRLRAKIRLALGDAEIIHTIQGSGYVIRAGLALPIDLITHGDRALPLPEMVER